MARVSDISDFLNLLHTLTHFKYYGKIDVILKGMDPNKHDLDYCLAALRGTCQHIDDLNEWKSLGQRIKQFCIQSEDEEYDYKDILMGLLDKIV